MRLQEIGFEIRRARLDRGLTQAKLAKAVGVSRVTLNQLETGMAPNLGARKLQALLDGVGLTLAIQPKPKTPGADFIRTAAMSASVSFQQPLTEAELIRALLSGNVPPAKRPHFRMLLEEARPNLVRGLLSQVSRWSKPGKVEKNLAAIAREVGATERMREWLKTS